MPKGRDHAFGREEAKELFVHSFAHLTGASPHVALPYWRDDAPIANASALADFVWRQAKSWQADRIEIVGLS